MYNHNHKGVLGKILMVLCIATPVAGLTLFVLNRLGLIAVGSFLPFALLLLCLPIHLMMIPLMFRFMNGGKKSDSESIG